MQRICTICGILKELSRAQWVWASKRGAYGTVCKQCHSAKCKAIMAVKLSNQAYRADQALRKKNSRLDPVKRANDLLAAKAWQKANKDKTGSVARVKRCLYKPKAEERFLIREAYALAKLRSVVTGIPWCVDHIIPLNGRLVSGLHVIENLQVITSRSNSIKFNKQEP